ncbi:hypothetical protein TNCV_1887471 [Trichonephila clavipes]|nr:hypothetical protein TNCV_1887471 [Trichonephila clavipes]
MRESLVRLNRALIIDENGQPLIHAPISIISEPFSTGSLVLRTIRDANNSSSFKQPFFMKSSGSSHLLNLGYCGRIQFTKELRSCSIPVTPHYNGQIAIFSGHRGRWKTLRKLYLDQSGTLKLFPYADHNAGRQIEFSSSLDFRLACF